MFINRILVFVSLAFFISYVSAETIVSHPVGQSSQDTRYDYMIKLLVLLLDKTKTEFGSYRLQPTVPMTQDRLIMEVKKGYLDVTQLPVSQKANDELRAIKIPMRKGMLGWRLLMIRKDRIADFAKVRSLSDLKKFKAGFGKQWSDLPIIQHNVQEVITSNDYQALFRMLAGRRFDYLNRGLHEPWSEQRYFPDLHIEETIAIHYPICNFLYVSKSNTKLANRIESGFHKAIKDGSFDELFKNEYNDIIQNANISGRTIIKFENPYLPEDTPLNNKNFWLQF